MRLVSRQRFGIFELAIDHDIDLTGDRIRLRVLHHFEHLRIRNFAEALQAFDNCSHVFLVPGTEKHNMTDHG